MGGQRIISSGDYMLLKTGEKNYHIFSAKYNNLGIIPGEYDLFVVGKIYSPQKRTIKYYTGGLCVRAYLDFPVLHFYKYKIEGKKTYYFYSCLAEDGKVINTSNIDYNSGIVCLGDEDYTVKNLDMGEFISLFWQSRFTYFEIKNNVPELSDFNKILPTVWDDQCGCGIEIL